MSWKENPYFIIPQLIQDLCLLFYHLLIDTKILTDSDQDLFLDLLSTNNKFIGTEWTLLYRKSTDGKFNDKPFIRKKYQNKKNILCIIQSVDNDILGGYSCSGWTSSGYNHDEKAYIFGIRSSKGYKPVLSNIKPKSARTAVYSSYMYYLEFGQDSMVFLSLDYVHNYIPSIYESLPTHHHLLGGEQRKKLKDVEIFQIKE